MIAFADDHLKGLTITNSDQITRIFDVYRHYQEISGLKVSLEKTVILGINTNPELLQEIAAITGIKVVTEFKHLGLQIRPTYDETKQASYMAVEESTTNKCNRINSSFVDLFHKRQLIKTVVVPSYNHIYMSLGYCAESGQRLDNQILKLLWTKKINGQIKQGRRIVAKKRINASYEMGGLKIDFSRETAMGLLANMIQKQQNNRGEEENQSFINVLFKEYLREIDAPRLEELTNMSGPKIWKKYSKKLENKSPFFSQVLLAMAEMLELNEKDKDSWGTANIAGHSSMHTLYDISAADGITLAHYNFTHVLQLFGTQELTGTIDLNQNATYPEQLQLNHPWITEKCKNLRIQIKNLGRNGCSIMGNFFQNMGGVRFSGLYRRMRRGALDATMPGPPSYFSRRRDGIPTPALNLFMRGYRNLFEMDISSKTLENSYLIMNRQIWTNEKQYLSTVDGVDAANGPSCALCGGRENTMHLMFECEQYSEPLWKELEGIINATIARINGREQMPYRIEMHAFLVLYSVWRGAPCSQTGAIMALIQEIKRNIVFRRFKRETTNSAIRCDRARLLGHLLITVRKLESLRKYQGKNHEFYYEIQQTIANLI